VPGSQKIAAAQVYLKRFAAEKVVQYPRPPRAPRLPTKPMLVIALRHRAEKAL
jgi:hypothetical protein